MHDVLCACMWDFLCSFLGLTLVLNGVKTNTLKVLLHYFTISLKKKPKKKKKKGFNTPKSRNQRNIKN